MPNFADRLRDNQREQPTLSMPMIVKNEAETLEKCLRLARPHVDEIVIVDTGSTDGTRAIARRYADTYDEIEWPDSFSKARNHSLDLATGDYILIVDGDEYIEGAEHWQKIRRALHSEGLVGAQLIQHNLLGEEGLVEANREWVDRLFLNHPDIRFMGRVHNQIQPGIRAYIEANGGHFGKLSVDIVHTGYALPVEDKKDKYGTRIELLRAEYEDPRSEGFKAYYGFQLGVVYAALHEWEKAAEILEKIDYSQLSETNAFYARLKAGRAASNQDDMERALYHGDQMLALERSEPVAYYFMGLALLKTGHPADGLLMLLEAQRINSQVEEIRYKLNHSKVLGMLADLCERAGWEKYAAAFKKLSEQEPLRLEEMEVLIERLKTQIILAEQQHAENSQRTPSPSF